MKVSDAAAWLARMQALLSQLPPDAELGELIVGRLLGAPVSAAAVASEREPAASVAAPKPRSKNAIRQARHRAKKQAERNAAAHAEALLAEQESNAGNACNAGGTLGGPVLDDGERQGKESGSPDPIHPEQPERSGPPSNADGTRNALLSHDADALEVFEFWNVETSHRATYDRKRKNRIKARLREGKTVEQLKQAIKNRKNDPFLMGDNDHGKVYDGIETLLRDAAQVERLVELTAPLVRRQKLEPNVTRPGSTPVRSIRMNVAKADEVKTLDYQAAIPKGFEAVVGRAANGL